MNATGEWRDEQRKRAQEEAKFGGKPDDLTQEEWEMIDDSLKKRVAEGRMDERELQNYLDMVKGNSQEAS